MKIINCIGGIGDILFCEPIFKHFFKKDGCKPTVVIHTHMLWIQRYIESAIFVSGCPPEFQTGSLYHSENNINLRYANQIFRGFGPDDHHDLENMMLDKYRLLGLPEDLWKTLDVNLVITNSTVPILFGDFILYNERSQIGEINIHKKKLYKECRNMYDRLGSTLIDWWANIRYAIENHHVSTSTFYLMQAIKNKYPEWNSPCYIYPRPNIDGLRGISQLKPDFNLIRVEK